MHRLISTRLPLLLLTIFLLLGSSTAVFAQTDADSLPDDNLVQNPWFRNGNQPSLDGWLDTAGNNAIWSLSQKRSNPTPDQVVGTSARLAFGSGQGGGVGQDGVDAYLYQVVAADPSLTHLKFKIHWVTQWIDKATVTIYGGGSADGPWTAVWVPLDIDQSTSSGGAWTQTELLDTTIAEGFPFYKVELFGRYPAGRQQGVKYTGVYFAVDNNAGEIATPLPEIATPTAEPISPEPTLVPAQETIIPPTHTPTPELALESAAVSAASTPDAEQTRPSARPAQPTRTPRTETQETAVEPNAPANDTISGVYLIIIAVLLLIVIALGVGWARAARR